MIGMYLRYRHHISNMPPRCQIHVPNKTRRVFQPPGLRLEAQRDMRKDHGFRALGKCELVRPLHGPHGRLSSPTTSPQRTLCDHSLEAAVTSHDTRTLIAQNQTRVPRGRDMPRIKRGACAHVEQSEIRTQQPRARWKSLEPSPRQSFFETLLPAPSPMPARMLMELLSVPLNFCSHSRSWAGGITSALHQPWHK